MKNVDSHFNQSNEKKMRFPFKHFAFGMKLAAQNFTTKLTELRKNPTLPKPERV